MRRAARPGGRGGRARHPAHGVRRRGQGAHRPPDDGRAGTRLAAAHPAVVGRQRLQARVRRRGRGRLAAADAQRLLPRRRRGPPLLGLRAALCAGRAGPGAPPRQQPRAAVEPLRPHSRGPRHRLGRAAAVRVIPARTNRARWGFFTASWNRDRDQPHGTRRTHDPRNIHYRVGACAIVATLLVASPAAATGAAARYARAAAAPPAPNVTAFTITPRRFAVDAVPAPFFYITLDPPLVAPVARLDEPV